MSISDDLTKIRRSANRIQNEYAKLETQAGDLLELLTIRTEERDDARRDYGRASTRVLELEAEVRRLAENQQTKATSGDTGAVTQAVRGTLLDVLTYAQEHDQLNEGDTVRIHQGDATYDVTVGKVERPAPDTVRFHPQLSPVDLEDL